MMLFFYIPPQLMPDPLPAIDDFTWEGYKDGVYCWTLQTYFHLKTSGVECQLVSSIPTSGIIIAHRGCLDEKFRPNREQLLVCMQADWSRHPYAQVHIVQNANQQLDKYTSMLDRYFLPGKRYFVRLWPQAGIIPRNLSRARTIKHIAYMGRSLNLADELKSKDWQTFLDSHSIKWSLVEQPDKWADYSSIDATLSIRSFKDSRYHFKPATKLYNSWIAGVIPICGPESAYISEKKNKHDCLIVHSYEELKTELARIIHSQELEMYFKASVERASDISNSSITNDWKSILKKIEKDRQAWINQTELTRISFFTIRTVGKLLRQLIKRQ